MSEYTLRQLSDFCREHALDCEGHFKPDGRMRLRFERYQDRAIFHVECDFDHRAEHLPEVVMAKFVVPVVKTQEERVRLETPR